MPRRKQANTNGNNDVPPPKKSKSVVIPADRCPQIDGIKVRWEYEDTRKWLPYSENNTEQLTDRYNGGDREVELTDGKSGKLLVSLDRLTYKTKRAEKRIRCCLQDEDDKGYYSWQWKNPKGKWEMYGVLSCLALENAFKRAETTVDIVTSNQSLLINLQKLEQSNVVTSVTSPVQRVKSEMPNPASTNVLIDTCSSGSDVGAAANGSTASSSVLLPQTTAKKKSGKSSGQSGSQKVKKETTEQNSSTDDSNGKKIKTVVVCGMAPVDTECPLVSSAHVFTQGSDVWDCMLNQTNTTYNNNKYYLVQLLKQDKSSCYYVWQRWGRVGYKGQNNLIGCATDLDKAIEVFTKKFFDKTKNEWSERHKFKKIAGKYDLLQMDYSTQGKDEFDGIDIKKEPGDEVPDSKLHSNVQELIRLISDIQSMKETVIEMKYDAQKAPLGRLTVEQINAGYKALKKIVNCIQSDNFGVSLSTACDEFYTRIPHTFGMKKPPVICDSETVKAKIQLLEALGDIEIAISILKQGDLSENPVDRTYKSLECEIFPILPEHPDFKLVENYLLNTHAATHTRYSMKLIEVYNCSKPAEEAQFIDYGNRMLLWHGSRLTNWVGILSRGLRIAPPEAPVTGDMFGKGIYFADMSSKSTNYCFATKNRNIGLALLCEVSLGEIHELLESNYYADKLPQGKHSVKGMGRVAPDPNCYKALPNGAMVPMGKSVETGVLNPNGYTLNYNEYVIYDTRQVKMKYLVKIKFDFK